MVLVEVMLNEHSVDLELSELNFDGRGCPAASESFGP